MYEHRPHLGSNKLPLICRNFRRKIEALRRRVPLRLPVGRARRRRRPDRGREHIRRLHRDERRHSRASATVARDTYEMLHELRRADGGEGVSTRPAHRAAAGASQPPEIRPSRLSRPAGGRRLHARRQRAARPVSRSACAPAGVVIPSVSEPGMFCTQRHEQLAARHAVRQQRAGGHARTGRVRQRPSAGRRRTAAAVRGAAFRAGGRRLPRPDSIGRAISWPSATPQPHAMLPSSYQRGTRPVELCDTSFRRSIAKAVRTRAADDGQKMAGGNFLKHATLVGPEMRGSSPVRIDRDPQTRECPGFAGLYPVGEGAGYAGGIVTAAVDGLRSAKCVVARYAALEQPAHQPEGASPRFA